MISRPPINTRIVILFPYTRLFRSRVVLGEYDTIAASSERVIVDHIESRSGHQIAGDLEFGTNGFLYISVGDVVCSVIGPTHCGPTNRNSQLDRKSTRLNSSH